MSVLHGISTIQHDYSCSTVLFITSKLVLPPLVLEEGTPMGKGELALLGTTLVPLQ